jgi:hypothetical protein
MKNYGQKFHWEISAKISRNTRIDNIFVLLFYTEKFMLNQMGWATYILGDLFTNSSGHPALYHVRGATAIELP